MVFHDGLCDFHCFGHLLVSFSVYITCNENILGRWFKHIKHFFYNLLTFFHFHSTVRVIIGITHEHNLCSILLTSIEMAQPVYALVAYISIKILFNGSSLNGGIVMPYIFEGSLYDIITFIHIIDILPCEEI